MRGFSFDGSPKLEPVVLANFNVGELKRKCTKTKIGKYWRTDKEMLKKGNYGNVGGT
jgi:hypothetical protein